MAVLPRPTRSCPLAPTMTQDFLDSFIPMLPTQKKPKNPTNNFAMKSVNASDNRNEDIDIFAAFPPKQKQKRRQGTKTTVKSQSMEDTKGEEMKPWCDICKLDLNAHNQLEQHYAGKSHAKRLKMMQREAEELVKTAAESHMDPNHSQAIPHRKLVKRIIDSNAPRGENGKLYCTLCDVSMPSPQVAQTHFGGKKHLKKLDALKQTEVRGVDDVVDVTAPGAVGTDVTLVRAIKKLQIKSTDSNPPTARLKHTACSATSSTYVSSATPTELPSVSTTSSVSNSSNSHVHTVAAFRCDICCVTMPSMAQLTEHQTGLKHLKKLSKESASCGDS